MKRPGEKNHRKAAEAEQSARGGREATGPEEEEGPRPTPRQKRRQLNVEPSPLQSRPADQRMTKTHPEDGPEKRSQEPNCSHSFTRDQIVRFRLEKGDPILKEYRPDIQRRLRFDRVGEKPHSTRRVTPSRSN